jgi:uncharacterized protein YuzE
MTFNLGKVNLRRIQIELSKAHCRKYTCIVRLRSGEVFRSRILDESTVVDLDKNGDVLNIKFLDLKKEQQRTKYRQWNVYSYSCGKTNRSK